MANCMVSTGNSSGVNVRSSKAVSSSNLLGVIDNGVYVNVVRCDGTWATLMYQGAPAFLQHQYLMNPPTTNGDGLDTGSNNKAHVTVMMSTSAMLPMAVSPVILLTRAIASLSTKNPWSMATTGIGLGLTNGYAVTSLLLVVLVAEVPVAVPSSVMVLSLTVTCIAVNSRSAVMMNGVCSRMVLKSQSIPVRRLVGMKPAGRLQATMLAMWCPSLFPWMVVPGVVLLHTLQLCVKATLLTLEIVLYSTTN